MENKTIEKKKKKEISAWQSRGTIQSNPIKVKYKYKMYCTIKQL